MLSIEDVKEKKNHFLLHVRQSHIGNQWEDVLLVGQRKGEVCRKNSNHLRKDSSHKQSTFILVSLKLYLMPF